MQINRYYEELFSNSKEISLKFICNSNKTYVLIIVALIVKLL